MVGLKVVIPQFVHGQCNLKRDLREGLLVSGAELYGESIKNTGDPLDSFVGFIDRTKIQMLRPGGHGSIQRSCYYGHKRFYCMIHQTVTTPDGAILNLYGPVVGRRPEITLLRDSKLQDRLQACFKIDDRQFYLYRDAAYMIRP